MSKKKTWLLLLFIIALSIFLRVYRINSVPPGLYPDEAVNGIDAEKAASTGDYKLFYEENNGREGLFMNIIAVFFKTFGVSMLTFKLASIMFGVLAVWGVYLLGAELFQNRRIGLIAAFLISVSFWAINFSRIGFRAIMVPALLAFSFFFLFRGMRNKRWYDFAAGGLIFGLGLHTYIAFRIAPLVLVIMLVPFFLVREKFLKKYWISIIVFILFAFLSAAPMLWDFFIAHPEHWASRTSEISILNPTTNQGHLLQTFGKTFGLALAKYNFWGDQNWRQNYPPYAILDPLTGIAFLFGIIYVFSKMIHLFIIRFKKKVRDEKLEVYVFLVSLFFVMLIPEVMGYEGNPHALRAIGTMPVVFLFAALTFNYFLTLGKNKSYLYQKLIFSLVILMLLSIGLFNSLKYFVFWPANIKTAQSFEKTMMDAENYIATIPPQKEIYVITANMQRVPPRFFNWKNPYFHDLHPAEMDSVKPKNAAGFEVIFTDYQKDQIISYFTSRYPDLKLETKTDSLGESFFVLK